VIACPKFSRVLENLRTKETNAKPAAPGINFGRRAMSRDQTDEAVTKALAPGKSNADVSGSGEL
jgi:hypothetical protein